MRLACSKPSRSCTASAYCCSISKGSLALVLVAAYLKLHQSEFTSSTSRSWQSLSQYALLGPQAITGHSKYLNMCTCTAGAIVASLAIRVKH